MERPQAARSKPGIAARLYLGAANVLACGVYGAAKDGSVEGFMSGLFLGLFSMGAVKGAEVYLKKELPQAAGFQEKAKKSAAAGLTVAAACGAAGAFVSNAVLISPSGLAIAAFALCASASTKGALELAGYLQDRQKRQRT